MEVVEEHLIVDNEQLAVEVDMEQLVVEKEQLFLDREQQVPLHKEWWFQIVVTLVLAILIQILVKRRSSSSSTSSSPKSDERAERLLYSRLLEKDDSHDLALKEEVEEKTEKDVTEEKEQNEKETNGTAEGAGSADESPAKDALDIEGHETSEMNGNAQEPDIQAEVQRSIPGQVATEQATRSQSPPPLSFPSLLKYEHPGLDAFWYWWDVNTSLFRIYTLARTDGQEVSPPYNPSSRRGVTPISLKITNGTREDLVVYWVDYKGKYIHKGTIRPNHVWLQTTWIDHPWVFCRKDTDTAILYYIPYRVIPTTKQEPTTDPDEPDTGVHRFTIQPPRDSTFYCQVADPVLPFPARNFFLTHEIAVAWTLLHCHRMSNTMHIEWNSLIKYLSKILHNPEEPKYRKLRLSNPIFSPVWNSPLQGLLLAVGFVEHHEYLYLGTSTHTLPRERVQELAQLVYHLEQYMRYEEGLPLVQQPEGADGFGREGYGRMGMNM